MKQHILIILILVFSALSGALWAYAFLQWTKETPDTKNRIPVVIQTDTKEAPKKQEVPSHTDMLKSLEETLIHTAENVAPSVVSIIIKKDLVIYRSDPYGFFKQPAGTISRQVGGGSGFFIKKDGTILTNKHVVSDRNADYTVILSDGTEYDTKVLAHDPITDLAVIKITDEERDFPVLPLVSATEDINVGSFSLAVWNALAEFQNSVSLGIISGKDRTIEAGGDTLSGLLQTDAAINPGNSGGPLITLDGKVIGINTAIASGWNGIGFAIALSDKRVDYILESIRENGRIKRPFIGINYIWNSTWVAKELNLAKDYGVYVIDEAGSIIEGSSAQKAGIEPGDIILEANGEILKSPQILANIIQNSIPGNTLELKVFKKSGREVELSLELGEY